jgi:hypothetical protein
MVRKVGVGEGRKNEPRKYSIERRAKLNSMRRIQIPLIAEKILKNKLQNYIT